MNASPGTPLGSAVATSQRSASYRWWVVFLLWFVCFFNYADRQAISSVFPILAREFHFDNVQLGVIGSAFAWVYAGFAIVAGLVSDRFSRKTVILFACVIWSVFTLATAWCGALVGFVSVRALTGLGETLYFPAAMSLLSDYHGRRTRSVALSWHQSAVYAGTIGGSWMAAILAERMGWQFPFYLFGPIGILLAAILFAWLDEPLRGAADGIDGPAIASHPRGHKERLSVRETLAAVFHAPAAALLMTAFLLANSVAVIFLVWMPTFLVRKFDFSISSAGLNATVFIHLASAAVVPVAGYLADRSARWYSGGRVLIQAIGLVFGAIFVFAVGRAANVAFLMAAMTLFGVGKGFYDSGIFASLYDLIEPRARGTAAGIMNTVGWGGGALGPLAFGWIAKNGGRGSEVENMSHVFTICAYVYLAGAALLCVAMFLFARNTSYK